MGIYPAGVRYRGLNRAGAEYGANWYGWTGEKSYFFDLTKPLDVTKLDNELKYNAAKGFNVIRLPIAWERLQHTLNGPLDSAYKGNISAFVQQATAAKFLVVIDLHNYNRYTPDVFNAPGLQVKGEPAPLTAPDGSRYWEPYVFGDGRLDTSHLVDVWTKIAEMLLAFPNVAFGIMNEPHDSEVSTDAWFSSVQTVINAIRATKADQLILVPNNRGSDVRHWDEYVPSSHGGHKDSEAALTIKDCNYAFDMHQYYPLDHPNPSEVSKSYADLMTIVTSWAAKNDKRLFLSEFGVPNDNPSGKAFIGNLLEYLNSNNNVWIGWTLWNLPDYNVTQIADYTADGSAMAWYTPYLTPNIVNT